MVFAIRTLPAVVLAIPLLPAVGARADDWPQWRGPNRDGVWNETGILEEFPPGGLEARWRAPIGPGFSSPVVARGRVYVTDSSLTAPRARERVHAFEEATGKPLWSHVYDVNYPEWAFDEKNPFGPTATPVVQDGRIYTLGAFGQLSCLDAAEAGVIWKKDLAAEYPGKELSCRASPLIDGDHLIVFVGAKPGACLIAFDRNTGKESWKALDESATHSSPILVDAGGARQLIVWTQESVTALDPATGKSLWRQGLLTSSDYVVSTPVRHGNRLLIGGLMLELDPEKAAASPLWPETRAVSRRILSHTSTALFQGDHLYSARSTGELVCIEAGTGRQVWESKEVTDLINGASIHITPNGDAAFLYTERGELIRARLAPEGYREIDRARLVEPTYPFSGRNCAWAPPAYANRRVFARTDKELVCASLAAKP